MSKKRPTPNEFYRSSPAPDWFPREDKTLESAATMVNAAEPYFEPREMKVCPTCAGRGMIDA